MLSAQLGALCHGRQGETQPNADGVGVDCPAHRGASGTPEGRPGGGDAGEGHRPATPLDDSVGNGYDSASAFKQSMAVAVPTLCASRSRFAYDLGEFHLDGGHFSGRYKALEEALEATASEGAAADEGGDAGDAARRRPLLGVGRRRRRGRRGRLMTAGTFFGQVLHQLASRPCVWAGDRFVLPSDTALNSPLNLAPHLYTVPAVLHCFGGLLRRLGVRVQVEAAQCARRPLSPTCDLGEVDL